MKKIVTRFAPSPTGYLHAGHAFSALKAHDLARAAGGLFLLRIEDVDPGRTRDEYVDAILADLLWLGIPPDGEIVYQSDRMVFYAAALEELRARGLVYPCFCTRSEIAAEIGASASAPHGPDGPAYPGTCRRLGPAKRTARMAREAHAWRLDMAKALAAVPPGDMLQWRDEKEGMVSARPEMFGDVVLARKDAPTSYHLAVTIDDAAQRISDVVRGRDLFDATHVHRLLQALFGLPTPAYHHHALLTDVRGRRLAKRHGAPTLKALRVQGQDGPAFAARLRAGLLPYGYSCGAA